MRKTKLLVAIAISSTMSLCKYNIVQADVDAYILKNEVTNELNQYNKEELIQSFLNYKSVGEKDVLYMDAVEKLKDSKLYMLHDESGKYVSYEETLKEYENEKVKNEGFYLEEFIKHAEGVEAPKYVYDRLVKDEKVVSGLNLTKDNLKKDFKVDKFKEYEDLRITGNNVTISNADLKGTLTLDPGKVGSVYVNNVKSKDIKVLSGGENSIHLMDVEAENLGVKSNSNVRVVLEGKTLLEKTTMYTYGVIDSKSGKAGTIIIACDETESGSKDKKVELRGEFTEPIIVESSVVLKTDSNTIVSKVEVAPHNKDVEVNLQGNFKDVEIQKESKINIDNDAKITGSLKIISQAQINSAQKAEIAKVDIAPRNKTDEVKLNGNFKQVQVNKEASIYLGKNTIISKFEANVNLKLHGDKTSSISKIEIAKNVAIAVDKDHLTITKIEEKGSSSQESSSSRDDSNDNDNDSNNSPINPPVESEYSRLVVTSNDINNPTNFGESEVIQVNGDVTVSAGSNSFGLLRNLTIHGNLIINGVEGEGGSVYLNNIIVSGKVIVNEVATNSLHLQGVQASEIEVKDVNGARIVAEDNNNINNIILNAETQEGNSIKVEGNFENTNLNINDAAKVQIAGYIKNVEVANNTEKKSEINIADEGIIGKLDVKSQAVEISSIDNDAAASIGQFNVNSEINNAELTDIKNKVDTYKEAVDEVVSIVNKIKSEAVEDNSLFYRRGRDIQLIIENPKYGFNLGNEYSNYSDIIKLRTSNTIRSYMQEKVFKTKKEIQEAINGSIKQNKLFDECGKFNGYFESPCGQTYISGGIIGQDVTDEVTKRNSELADGTIYEIYDPESEYLKLEDNRLIIQKLNETNDPIYISVPIEISVEGGGSSCTNLNVLLLPQNSLSSVEYGFQNKAFATKVGQDMDIAFNVKYPNYDNISEEIQQNTYIAFTIMKSIDNNNCTEMSEEEIKQLIASELSIAIDNGEYVKISEDNIRCELSSQSQNNHTIQYYRVEIRMENESLKALSEMDRIIAIRLSEVSEQLAGLPITLRISAYTEDASIYGSGTYLLVDGEAANNNGAGEVVIP